MSQLSTTEFQDWFQDLGTELAHDYMNDGKLHEVPTPDYIDLYNSNKGFKEYVDQAWQNACESHEAKMEYLNDY